MDTANTCKAFHTDLSQNEYADRNFSSFASADASLNDPSERIKNQTEEPK